jgi:hypothetical protein
MVKQNLRKLTSALAIATVICLLCPLARADVHKFSFNMFTQRSKTTTGFTDVIAFTIRISDTVSRAPDAITSLVVTAPDGTKFDLTENAWLEWTEEFWATFTADKFNSHTFPSGTYTATVIPKVGKTLTATEVFTPSFLSPAIVTLPTEGSTLSTLTPVFKWGAVKDAQHYKLHLKNDTWGDPVYQDPSKQILVYKTTYAVPKGVLIPGMDYSLRIEARDSDKDMNRRSRTMWIHFKTPAP